MAGEAPNRSGPETPLASNGFQRARQTFPRSVPSVTLLGSSPLFSSPPVVPVGIEVMNEVGRIILIATYIFLVRALS